MKQEIKDSLSTGRKLELREAMGEVMLTILPSNDEEAEELSITVPRDKVKGYLKGKIIDEQ